MASRSRPGIQACLTPVAEEQQATRQDWLHHGGGTGRQTRICVLRLDASAGSGNPSAPLLIKLRWLNADDLQVQSVPEVVEHLFDASTLAVPIAEQLELRGFGL